MEKFTKGNGKKEVSMGKDKLDQINIISKVFGKMVICRMLLLTDALNFVICFVNFFDFLN